MQKKRNAFYIDHNNCIYNALTKQSDNQMHEHLIRMDFSEASSPFQRKVKFVLQLALYYLQ